MEQISHEGIAEHVAGSDVRVRIIQGAACGGCSARSACTAAETAVKYVDATAPEGTIQQGDKVLVCVSKRLGWRAVLLAFIIPFIITMLVLSVLIYCEVPEAWAELCAIVAILPYYTLIYLLRDKIKAQYRFEAIKQ